MKHFCVRWHHTLPEEPVLIYHEIDAARWEQRKVEVYADGRIGLADSTQSIGGSSLSVEPIPGLDEIAGDAQFTVMAIDGDEFERVWRIAIARITS